MRGVMYRHYASSVLKFYSDMRMLREIDILLNFADRFLAYLTCAE